MLLLSTKIPRESFLIVMVLSVSCADHIASVSKSCRVEEEGEKGNRRALCFSSKRKKELPIHNT